MMLGQYVHRRVHELHAEITRLKRREQELLEANNRYLQEARELTSSPG
jgi:hypothetical protein